MTMHLGWLSCWDSLFQKIISLYFIASYTNIHACSCTHAAVQDIKGFANNRLFAHHVAKIVRQCNYFG